LDLSIEVMEDFLQSFQGIDGLKNFLLFLQSQMECHGNEVSKSAWMINLIQGPQHLFGKGPGYFVNSLLATAVYVLCVAIAIRLRDDCAPSRRSRSRFIFRDGTPGGPERPPRIKNVVARVWGQ
jgi:hypothetical protein